MKNDNDDDDDDAIVPIMESCKPDLVNTSGSQSTQISRKNNHLNEKLALDHVWPDGDTQFVVSIDQIRNKTLHFGWAFTMFASKKGRHSDVKTRYYYCLGVFKCRYENCHFLARPLKPTKMSLGAPPNAPKHTCPKHHNTALIWVPCGGQDKSFCHFSLQVTEDDNLLSFVAIHKGTH